MPLWRVCRGDVEEEKEEEGGICWVLGFLRRGWCGGGGRWGGFGSVLLWDRWVEGLDGLLALEMGVVGC
jgi:hypothetical protein